MKKKYVLFLMALSMPLILNSQIENDTIFNDNGGYAVTITNNDLGYTKTQYFAKEGYLSGEKVVWKVEEKSNNKQQFYFSDNRTKISNNSSKKSNKKHSYNNKNKKKRY